MTRRTAALTLAIALLAGYAFSQCDDIYDEVLCVETLTSDQEAQYSSTDGVLADFWNNWGTKDMIDMISPDNCYPDRCGFSGAGDASFTIKAAGTSRGLYVLSQAVDNTWVDRADAEDWGADAVDMYFADQSSDEIAACTDCLIGLYESALTYGTQQLQVWMGASAPPTGFRFAYYDENLWSWQTVGVEWTAAKVLYGFEAEVVEVNGTTKAQEWFFPWETFGGGIPIGTDLGGMRLALAGGYNDKDGDNESPHCLRWLGKDPWTIEDGETYWGDMHLAADMGTVESVVSVKPSTTRRAVAISSRGTAAAFYSLRGERIPAGLAAHRSAGILLQRGIQGTEMVQTIR